MANRTSSTTNPETDSSAASGHKSSATAPGSLSTPVQVLNPAFGPYAAFERAWKAGDLNPGEGTANGRYFSISKAYSNECQYNSDYYAVRAGRYIRHP